MVAVANDILHNVFRCTAYTLSLLIVQCLCVYNKDMSRDAANNFKIQSVKIQQCVHHVLSVTATSHNHES